MTAPEPAPRSRVPEPALVRSVLVAASGVLAYFLGRQIDTAWVDSLTTIYGLIAPIVAGLLIRPAVKPVKGAVAEIPAAEG
ncbi:hypothetical protein [Nocardia concava]|uniref:hypothetical protein n=1 Tax=Nocardia concava TaxID=257281 RepID=UPI000300362A|nr:hypothetical protein [Nocardia concava]